VGVIYTKDIYLQSLISVNRNFYRKDTPAMIYVYDTDVFRAPFYCLIK